MGSKSNTSTLLSTCSSSKVRHNQFRNNISGSGNYRYVVGSVGKACAAHLKWDGSSQDKAQVGQRHQNVAIATQVLNPSAIGGSLKNRRLVEHFGPSDDDEVGFLSDRRRSAWGKFCCYGVAIVVTVLMMTGLILAVGYMQSEKQKMISRPVKLAQGQSFEEGKLHLSTSTTTNLPPTLSRTTKRPSKNLDDDDIDEISIDDYSIVSDEDLQKLDQLQDISSEDDNEPKISPSKSINDESSEDDYFDKKKYSSTSKIEASHQDVNEDDDEHSSEQNEYENLSEVKVLPPADFKFNNNNGNSFEFPIYSKKNASSTKLNHDSGRSSSSSLADADEETKELETSVSDVNSTFTSFIDPIVQELNGHKDYKKEQGDSSNDLLNENYANAHIQSEKVLLSQNNNKPSSLSKSSSYSKEESDSSTNDRRNNDENDSNETENRPTTHSRGKISSSFSKSYETIGNKDNDEDNKKGLNEKHEEDKSYHTDSLHTATLQTDIFDDDDEIDRDRDFETSASEEVGRNKFKKNQNQGNNGRRPNTDSESSPRPKPHDNRYSPKDRDRGSGGRHNSRPSDDDNFEIYEDERPRSDPRKLSLKQKNIRNKVQLKGPSKSSNGGHRNSQSEDKEKPISIIELGSPGGPNSHNVPILEYKADFSRFTTPPPPQETTKFDFELQSQIYSKVNNPYPDFKFDFTTPTPTTESDTKYNLKDYNKNNNYNLELSSSAVPAATTDFNLNLAQVQPYTSLNEISSGSNSATSGGSNQNSQFSKRTYNFDFDPSTSGTVNSNTNSNPFTHLLGAQGATTGVFGSASATGATLNLFQPQQTFNYDNTGSSSTGHNIPSGTVPVDLSASHISVNNPSNSYGLPVSSASNLAFTVDSNGDFSLTNPNPSNLPYPNLEYSGGNFGTNANKGNPYSFSNTDYSNNAGNNGGSNGGARILTTGQGQVPTYNTITQGIHLLSLLSGNNQHNNGYNDHQSSASVFQPQELELSDKPQYQIAALTGYGGSSTQFLQGIDSQQANSITRNNDSPGSFGGFQTFGIGHSLPSYTEDFYPKKTFRSFENSGDQLPSASFSKSIVSKATGLASKLKPLEPTTEPSAFRSLLSSVKKNSESKSEPKSLSFSILPNAVDSAANTLFDKFTKPSSTASNNPQETDSEPLISKSRKRNHTGLTLNLRSKVETDADRDTAGSEIYPVTVTPSPTSLLEKLDQNKATNKKEGISVPNKTVARGLKSGFYS